MSKLNTKITLKRPTKKEIQSVLEVGVQLQTKVEEITQIIKRDLHHQDENHQTQLTKMFDKIMTGNDEELKTDVKIFIRKQVQTLIKEKPTQQAVLLDDIDKYSVTVKKVTKPMIENNNGLYADNFNESDEGSFRVIRMFKEEKEELTLTEELMKWMRSKKSDGLYTGEKGQEKDTNFYEWDAVIQMAEQGKKGLV